MRLLDAGLVERAAVRGQRERPFLDDVTKRVARAWLQLARPHVEPSPH